jgi:N-hydroxyarylamine O-acetyltransferase
MFFQTSFDLQRYLSRIGLGGAPQGNIQGVTDMMRAQLRHVPFENLDVQARLGVSLDPEQMVEKILGRGRGGYCYEVNGIFSMALQALGMRYQWVAARPMFYPVRRPRTHMAVIVFLDDGPYLCDLGFGSWGPTLPLSLNAVGQTICDGHDRFKLTRSDADGYVLHAWVNGAWVSQYGFDLSPQEWIDFEPMNHLNATHPEAIFVKQILVIQHTSEGRKILTDRRFKQYVGAQVSERLLSEREVADCLRQEFRLPSVADLQRNPHARVL